MCAVEIVRDRETCERFPAAAGLAGAASKLMARHGLLGRGGDVFFLAPALSITASEIDLLVERLDDVLVDLQDDLDIRGRAVS